MKSMHFKVRKSLPYFIVVGIVVSVLCVIYRDANILYPLEYANRDDIGVYYFVKTICEHSILLVNPMVGGNTGADMYDYICSDFFSFSLVKIISLFCSDIYVVTNLFYFLVYILISLSGLYVCKHIGYSNGVSIVVSVLFAFSPYIQMRYSHMWLVPYFMIPLSCMIAIKIVQGEILKEHIPWWKNNVFWIAILISFCCAFTGFYYAFFTCVLYAIAIVIRFFNCKIKDLKKEGCMFFLIISVVFGCILSLIPNVLYWYQNGMNTNSELTKRGIGESEWYGLKLIQMLLPRNGHRVDFLKELAQKYAENYPLVNENRMASIGIVASVGLIISLVWLFQNRRQDKKYSYFNISIFLVATMGGIGSIFSLFVPTPMRCYNRMSLYIMFFSLLCVAEILDEIRKKWTGYKFTIFLLGLLLLGIYDQTIDYKPYDYQMIDSNKEFVEEIERALPEDSLVYQLPYVDWPSGGNYRMFIGYLESNSLRWSHGAMQGRDEAIWQENVSLYDVNTILPILVAEGYSGIYLDKVVYCSLYGEKNFEQIVNDLTSKLNAVPTISNNGELYFWSLLDYHEEFLEKYSKKDSEEIINFSEAILNTKFKKGFYKQESDGINTWNWGQKSGRIVIINNGEKEIEVNLSMLVHSSSEKGGNLVISDGEKDVKYQIDNTATNIELVVQLKPGKNKIEFDYDGEIVCTEADGRELAFVVMNFRTTSPYIK